MVAFITQHHAVVRYQGFYLLCVSLEQRLHDGDIYDSALSIFPCANLADPLQPLFPASLFGLHRQGFLNIKKLFQRCLPLL